MFKSSKRWMHAISKVRERRQQLLLLLMRLPLLLRIYSLRSIKKRKMKTSDRNLNIEY